MDEQEALRRLKREDERALEWFINRYAAYVNTIIYNITGSFASECDIEEISCDVFFTLWVNAKRVAPGKAKAYLGGVARNKAKERTRKIGAKTPLALDALVILGENPQRELEAREQARYIRKALLAMEHPEREIFFRYYYFYQPVAQIAEEMGINLSTVKTKLRRGRAKLKTLLEKGGYTVED